MQTDNTNELNSILNKFTDNSKKRLEDASNKILHSYDHEAFTYAIVNKKLRIEITNQKKFAEECFDNLGSNIALVLLILSIVPYIIVPIICYKYEKWILLIGIIGLLSGQIIAYVFRVEITKTVPKIIFAFLLIAITFYSSYSFGILHTLSFTLVCSLYQFLLLYVADIINDKISLNYLIRDSTKYEKAVLNNLIRVKFN